MRLGLATHLLRLAELRDKNDYHDANALLVGCDPKSFLKISRLSLESALKCLAAHGHRDQILAIAAEVMRSSLERVEPDLALIVGAACLGVNAEAEADALFASWRDVAPSSSGGGYLSGVFPVRTLFPNHWERVEEFGYCTFALPSIMGKPREQKVRLPLPHDGCAVMENALIAGAFTVLDDAGSIIVYDLAGHPRYPYVAGHNSLMKGSPLVPDRAVMHYSYWAQNHLPKAVHLSGRCASNYFHWLVEYLPRILNAIEAGADPDAALLVPAKSPSSMRRALDLVNNRHFPVHTLAKGTLLKVDRLYVPSMHSCVVDGLALPLPQIGGLSARHLRFVRERILQYVERNGVNRCFPERVYSCEASVPARSETKKKFSEFLRARGLR